MAHIPIPPNSVVKLYQGVDITGGQEIAFPSPESQYSYFKSKLYKQFTNQTYTRHDGQVVLNCSTVDAHNSNFLSFNNPSFEAKPFYARIVNWEYVNNNTTRIFYEMDWFQTYMFEVSYGTAMIEREHMLEASYNSALENPWASRDPYMYTEEPLVTGSSLEKIYESGDFFFTPAKTAPNTTNENLQNILSFYSENYTLNTPALTVIMATTLDYAVVSEKDKQDPLYKIVKGLQTANVNHKIGLLGYSHNYGGSVGLVGVPLSENWSQARIQIRKAMSVITDELAVNNITSSVLGMYIMPLWFIALQSLIEFQGTITVNMPTPNPISGVHPKLNCMPFRYIRMENAAGEGKEYYIEYFINQRPNFVVFTTINGLPQISIIPVNYKYNGTVLRERFDFNGFPQLAYSTDQYLSYIGSQYQNIMVENTPVSEAQLKNEFALKNNPIALATEAFGDLVNGTLLAASDTVLHSNLRDYYTAGTSFGEQLIQQQQLSNALSSPNLTPSQKSENYSSIYTSARKAFVDRTYNPGAATGAAEYYNGVEELGFKVTYTELRADVLANYNNYLRYYGCAAKRLGTPYVCSWIQGGGQPHFEQLTNGPTTYVKTENMHVVSKNAQASNYIEQLFNNGCFFLKGDSL